MNARTRGFTLADIKLALKSAFSDNPVSKPRYPFIKPLIIPEENIIESHTFEDRQIIIDSARKVRAYRDPISMQDEFPTVITVYGNNHCVFNLACGVIAGIADFNQQIFLGLLDRRVAIYDRAKNCFSPKVIFTDDRINSITPLADEEHVATGHTGYIDIWHVHSCKHVLRIPHLNSQAAIWVYPLADDSLGYIEKGGKAGKYEMTSVTTRYNLILSELTLKISKDEAGVVLLYAGFFNSIYRQRTPSPLSNSPLSCSSVSSQSSLEPDSPEPDSPSSVFNRI